MVIDFEVFSFVGSEGLGFFMYHAGSATPRISWSFCMGASLSLPLFGHQASHHALLCNHARDGALLELRKRTLQNYPAGN